MRNLSWLETIPYRGTTAVLIFVILTGAVCPPLYAGVLPHDHLFIGGPPPINWRQHHHHDPLAALFGSGATDPAIVVLSEPAILGTPGVEPAQTGRVVSLFAAPAALVLSVIALAMLIPGWLFLSLATILGTVRTHVAVLLSAEPAAPWPPPPRPGPDPSYPRYSIRLHRRDASA
ncbi:MAG TPA: hypothetical protein VFZ25_00300 [Chloroflexota bacterium]|nr:hypothetical protein [Chloroflexota bacterium]